MFNTGGRSISIDNKKSLILKGNEFKSEFEKAFHQEIILSSTIVDTENVFNFENLSIDKFFLIPDHELNIFRNFVSELMTKLDRFGTK